MHFFPKQISTTVDNIIFDIFESFWPLFYMHFA